MWSTLFSLVAPRSCGLCSRPGDAICRVCIAESSAQSVWRSGARVWLAAAHRPELVQFVVGWKDRSRWSDTRVLAELVAGNLAEEDWWRGSEFAIVPVPSRRDSYRARGWRPVPELAAEVCRLAGARLLPALAWSRQVADQRGLSGRERQANLDGAFTVTAEAPPRVFLLDDILTSGATLLSAGRALSVAGAGEVRLAAVTAARPERRIQQITDQNPLVFTEAST